MFDSLQKSAPAKVFISLALWMCIVVLPVGATLVQLETANREFQQLPRQV